MLNDIIALLADFTIAMCSISAVVSITVVGSNSISGRSMITIIGKIHSNFLIFSFNRFSKLNYYLDSSDLLLTLKSLHKMMIMV